MQAWLLILLGMGIMGCMVFLRERYAAFYGQTPDDYDDIHPTFDLKQHLIGEMVCEGIIYGPFGRVTSTFVADFSISWDGDKGVIDEFFRYNDGSTQIRQWRITAGTNGHFKLEADDVPGGGSGIARGSAVRMQYPIRLPESAGSHLMHCVDWMYMSPDGTIMNRSQFRKFGFKLAELISTIRPRDPS